jgi:hypothetical protein
MSIAQTNGKPTAERDNGVRAYISPSRLGLWARYPLAFRFRYIDGIKSPTNPNLFLGKVCHSGLEAYYRHRQLDVTLSPEDVAKRMIDGWDEAVAEESIWFETEATEMKMKMQVVDLVTAYLDHIPEDEPRPLAVEATME